MDFNWPPTEDELGQYANNFALVETEARSHATGLARVDSSVTPARDEPDTASIETVLAMEERQPSRIDGAATFAIAEVQNETASVGSGTGKWAAEIARLQALLDGLTEKVDW